METSKQRYTDRNTEGNKKRERHKQEEERGESTEKEKGRVKMKR